LQVRPREWSSLIAKVGKDRDRVLAWKRSRKARLSTAVVYVVIGLAFAYAIFWIETQYYRLLRPYLAN
jgi:hypothetical protein